MNPWKLIIDVAGGVVLFVLLLMVLIVDRLTAPAERPVQNTLDVRIVTESEPKPAEQRKLRLAVLSDPAKIPGGKDTIWDDMSTLLNQMGAGYQHDTLRTKDVLADPGRLDQYDVLFFTCAPDGLELRDALVRFVGRGGILYASDWRFDAIANAFPDFVDPATRGEGNKGRVTAEVVDPGLREIIGPSIELQFDLVQWKTAAFKGPRVSVLLQGKYRRLRNLQDTVGEPASAPLLVRFTVGRGGHVIFTSFHNEKQNSETEKKLLQYLIFAMVTADVDAKLQSHVSEGGFAPQRTNLLSTPRDNPSVTKTFRNPKVGPVRFALGFRDEGARLKLQLRAPDGKGYTWEGPSTVVLEVRDAAAGDWQYTVTALELPYENFPFIVTVSEKK